MKKFISLCLAITIFLTLCCGLTAFAAKIPDITGTWYERAESITAVNDDGEKIKLMGYSTLEIISVDEEGNVTAHELLEYVSPSIGPLWTEVYRYGTFKDNQLCLDYTEDYYGFVFNEHTYIYEETLLGQQLLVSNESDDRVYTRDSFEKELEQEIKAFEDMYTFPMTGELLLQIGNPYMYVCGEPVELDAASILYNGRTMLPIRAVVEELGGVVYWDNATRQITIIVDDAQIIMWLNDRSVSVNGQTQLMDVAPITVNGRTLVPVRFVSDNIPGCKTVWDKDTESVSILY